jgi:hypothetical protein
LLILVELLTITQHCLNFLFVISRLHVCVAEIHATFLDESWTHHFQLGLTKIFRNVYWNHQIKLSQVSHTPALRQTGSSNLTGPKTLPTIWGTYMKLVTKYQISAINSC